MSSTPTAPLSFPDLIELDGIASFTTYTVQNGGILGVVDDATYRGDEDNDLTIRELNSTDANGGIVTIDGNDYAIEVYVPEAHDGTVTISLADGGSVDLTGDDYASEIAFFTAVPLDEGSLRFFAVTDDSVGDLQQINAIHTRAIDFAPAGKDVQIDASEDDHVSVVCFASGTAILTPEGERPVESLIPGDAVFTADNGVQTIRWAGRVDLTARDMAAKPSLRPIRIRAGALGQGLPVRDLVVSPQHRVLLRSKVAERMFGSAEVLVPAVKLLGLKGVERMDVARVSYHHILLDRHEIVFAEGAPAETLLMGAQACKSLPAASLAEIETLFPGAAATPARPLEERGRRVRSLIERHARNDKPVLEA